MSRPCQAPVSHVRLKTLPKIMTYRFIESFSSARKVNALQNGHLRGIFDGLTLFGIGLDKPWA